MTRARVTLEDGLTVPARPFTHEHRHVHTIHNLIGRDDDDMAPSRGILFGVLAGLALLGCLAIGARAMWMWAEAY